MSSPQPLLSISDSSLWIQNLVNGLSGTMIKVKHSVFCDSSPFQKIEVLDTYNFGRILILAGNVVLTEKDEFIYNEMISHPGLFSHPSPRRVCIIGGGDGGVLRETLKHGCVESVTVVEIDELVINTMRRFFPSMSLGFDDPRTTIIIDDGYCFMEREEKPFDVIIVDAYDPGGPVHSLMTADFFQFVAKRCAPGGIVVFQTDSPSIKTILRETLFHARPLFGSCMPYLCMIPSFPENLCSFVLCRAGGAAIPFDQVRFAALSHSCRYYNQEIHTGAFLLPQYIRTSLLH